MPDELLQSAYGLRHTAKDNSQSGNYTLALQEINEAIQTYRTHPEANPLDLANAIRIAALTHERQSLAFWHEACALYTDLNIQSGIAECNQHLTRLTE